MGINKKLEEREVIENRFEEGKETKKWKNTNTTYSRR